MAETDASSADSSAKIDLVSNNTIFRGLDAERHYKTLLRGGALPSDFFSSFIHEATHHWCFISPVGTALSLLYLRIAKRALTWALTEDELQTEAALDDLQAFQVGVAWMRPLNEGMAQFAEYDCLPSRRTTLISPPLLATLNHLFPAIREIRSGNADELLLRRIDREIMKHRLSPETIDRKADLLLQPVGAHKSPYLLGYLTIKQLWRSARRFYAELADPDVFLMFIRKFVFGDYALVAAILDHTIPGHARSVRIGQTLYERLSTIRLMHFDDEIPWETWAKLLQDPAGEEQPQHWLTLADPRPFAAIDSVEDVRRGLALQAEYFRDLSQPLDEKATDLGAPPDFFYSIMRERFLLWLGHNPARWRSSGHRQGSVLIGDEEMFEIRLENASDEGLDALRLDFYIDLYRNYQLTTLASEQGVFALRLAPGAGNALPEDLLEMKLDREQINTNTKLIQQLVESFFLAGTNYREHLREFWDQDGRELLGASYTGFAFNFDEEAQATVSEAGLEGVLQSDLDLIRAVAAMSLGASAGMTSDMLEAMCPHLQVDPRRAQQRVRERWPFDELPLAVIGDAEVVESAF